MITAVSSWVEPYIGRRWIEGERECWHQVVEVLEERFGITDLPLLVAGPDSRLARRLLSDHPERQAWTQSAEPREGDVVMMRQGALPCHVGVWVVPNHVLHSVRGSGTVLTEASRLPDMGYHVVGTYRRTP